MQTAIVAFVLAQLAMVQPLAPGPRMSELDADACIVAGADRAPPDTAPLQPVRGTRDCRALVTQPSLRRVAQEDVAPRDEWFAVDKVQHFAMAYGTAMFGYGVVRGAGASHGDARAAAIAGSLAAGLGKELFDRARGGPFSLKDLTWDALGTLAAWGLLSLNR